MAIDRSVRPAPYMTSNLIDLLRRRRALTGGRGVSQEEIAGVIQADLMTGREEAIQRSVIAQQRAMDLRRMRAEKKQADFGRSVTLQQLRMKREQIEADKDAAKVAGGVQMAGAAANMGLTYKLLSGGTGAGTTAATYTGATKTVEGVQFYQLSNGGWTSTAGEAGATSTAGSSAGGMSAGTMAGTVVGSAAAGWAGGRVGQTKAHQELTPLGGKKTEATAAGAASGAGAGFAIGGPWGAVIGAIVGGTTAYGDASGWW